MIPGVPKGALRAARHAFLAALQQSGLLANNRAIKTWIAWEGKEGPFPDPTAEQMPAAQVRLVSGAAGRVGRAPLPGRPQCTVNEIHPQVIIDLWTRGRDECDLADLAELIYAALNPPDPVAKAALEARFRAAGIKDWQLKRLILPASAESFAAEYCTGQGSFELTMFVNS